MSQYVDFDYHRDLRLGLVSTPWPEVAFMFDQYEGNILATATEARAVAAACCEPWKLRYPCASEPPLWVVSIPGGFCIVPNSLYTPNKPWEDLMAKFPKK